VDAGTNVLYIDQGIVIKRKLPSDVSFPLVGGVKLGPTITSAVATGYTYAGMVYASSYTLSNAFLYTGDPTTGVMGSNTQANADNVIVWNPATQTASNYWYRATASSNYGWRATISTIDVGTNQLPFGAVLRVNRKLPIPFNWVMPAPYNP
jgi:hypothetical protein